MIKRYQKTKLTSAIVPGGQIRLASTHSNVLDAVFNLVTHATVLIARENMTQQRHDLTQNANITNKNI
jgi:hypothetical protein